MHDAELLISVRKTSLNSRFFPFTGFLVKKNTKTFQGMLYRLDEFLFDNISIYIGSLQDDFHVEQCSIC